MAIQPKEIERVENTIVGESILINGKLEGDEDLTVRGRVMGSITLTKTLIVEPSGVVKADSTVRNAIVSGVVVGNITASESVHLTREGRMVGDINSPRVIIVEGAAFRGRIDMGEVAEPKLQQHVERPQTVPSARPASSLSARSSIPPSRPPAPPPRPPMVRPAAPHHEPPRAVVVHHEPARNEPVKAEHEHAKPPAPPPPPKAAEPAAVPVPVGIGKRKVVVKRKK